MDVDDRAGEGADDLMAKKLIRYAISCEYSRTPIRRDGIKERGTPLFFCKFEHIRLSCKSAKTNHSTVLGEKGRSFKRVFALAQKQLRLVWGMELRELPVKEKMTLHEKRKGLLQSMRSWYEIITAY